jgi:hypothetical protein
MRKVLSINKIADVERQKEHHDNGYFFEGGMMGYE